MIVLDMYEVSFTAPSGEETMAKDFNVPNQVMNLVGILIDSGFSEIIIRASAPLKQTIYDDAV